jgi:hypothetical protein
MTSAIHAGDGHVELVGITLLVRRIDRPRVGTDR